MAIRHGPPQTWPEVAPLLGTMDGFPFPDLLGCRDKALRGQERALGLEDGTGYYLKRLISASLFGAVYSGIKGNCDPNNPLSLRYPTARPHQYRVAVKKSALGRLNGVPTENIFREISVMRYLSYPEAHPCVMPLVAACISNSHLYVVTPLCAKGDLLKQITPLEGIPEQTARVWFSNILQGVGFMHRKGLCHHDLSPENVVISDRGAAVAMDFGMVQRIPLGPDGEPALMRDATRFGKPKYMAPEVYDMQEYDGRQADLWSVGTSFLVCMLGDYPWEAPTRIPTMDIPTTQIQYFTVMVQFGTREMLSRLGLIGRLSPEAIDLLCDLLVVDRAIRPTSCDELAQHHFFVP